MKATYSEVRGDEVYVYVRGQLVMKRWLNYGISALFQVAPSFVYSRSKVRWL